MTGLQKFALTALVVAGINLVAYVIAARAEGVTIAGGPARIVDGDTLALRGVRIRLWGIDAPEAGQTCERDGGPYACGAASTRALEAMAGGRDLLCLWRDSDRHRRLVAECWTLDAAGKREGETINERLVREGWAVAFVRYATAYIEHEREAREARRGLWSGGFQRPDEFRQAKKVP